jgi:hypothetical protein
LPRLQNWRKSAEKPRNQIPKTAPNLRFLGPKENSPTKGKNYPKNAIFSLSKKYRIQKNMK